ncbi:coiled-coil domain-containing protein 30 isoform X2 [Hypanus sabinus]|uniref:coiled-coil domain-containing protein 30 isoform X2 n=1 Tax=Hypanus sabinus TaxID=79690 RepID=UPI0028C40027|nr:coiled-coil domain-containing protein 30 isoform X2 [Hypanus sabinus]
MEGSGEEKVELEDILNRLREDGININACSGNEYLCHLWRIYQRSEAMLQSTKQDLEDLQKQQAAEMKEVDSYVDHIRNLSVEQEAVMAEYERENELLKAKLQQLQLEQETQIKEVQEMLHQEGLAAITHGGSSEQVAYLLVERATLLEKLELAERKVENFKGDPHGIQLQRELNQMQQTFEEELKQQRESMQHTKETMTKTHEVDLNKERKLREQAEQDLDEAAHRLQMAHEEIRRLTDELDTEKKVHCSTDFIELDKAKEENIRLDQEIQTLRHRVQSLDTERKSLLETVESLQKLQPPQTGQGSDPHHMEHVEPSFNSTDLSVVDDLNQDLERASTASDTPPSIYDSHHPRTEQLHRRCHHEINQLESKNHELQRKLHKYQQELEEVMLMKETLESTVESYQNHSKDDRHSNDCEKEVLKAKISTMEADYLKLKRKYKDLKAKSHFPDINPDVQERIKKSQEALESTQLKLDEEIKKREQLESTLAAAEQSKTREDEELEAFKTQVHHLNLELKNYHAAAEQNQILNQALERMKKENCILEEKFSKVVEDYKGVCKSQKETSSNEWKDMADGYLCQIDELKSTVLKLEEALNSKTMTDDSAKKVECLQQQLNTVLKENQQLNQEKIILQQQFCTNQQGSQILNQEYVTIRQQFICYQQENKILKEENLSVRKQMASCQQENQRLTHEVCNIQKQLNDLMLSKEKVEDSINQVQLQALKMEVSQMQSSLEFEQKNACQQKQTLELQLEESNNKLKSQEALLARYAEESRQLRQDLQRVHNLCSSAEKELKYKREQLIDLQNQNSLLGQENTRMKVDLNAVQCSLSDVDKHNIMLKSECEIKQQRLKEMELESSKYFHLAKQLKSTQEDLTAEKNRYMRAEKKTAELQQQLSSIQHQLLLSEAHKTDRVTLEAELKKSRETADKLSNQLQAETIQRKRADQNVEELQQQLKLMQEKEGCLSRGKCDLQLQLHQQGAQLQVLEKEKESMCSENLCIQKTNDKLSDDLCSRQQEIDKLKEELKNVFQQLDSQVRIYNEKQLRHKQKLRKAKEIFIREVMLRDSKIKHLETEIKLVKNLMEKEHAWNVKVTYENDLLLVERKDLLQQLSEQENAVRNNSCNVKHRSTSPGAHTSAPSTKSLNEQSQRKCKKPASRISSLEEESKQLQGETTKLSERLGSLENSLKMIKTDPGKLHQPDSLSVSFADEPCKFLYSDSSVMNDNFLTSTRETTSPSGINSFGHSDPIQYGRTMENSDAATSSYTPSPLSQLGVDYLNVSSRSWFKDQDDSQV